MIGSILLLRKGFIPEAVLYLCVVQMQLVEFFIWRNLRCDAFNRVVSRVGMVINHLEPIVFWLAIAYVYGLPSWLNAWMFLFAAFSLMYTISVWKKTQCTTPSEQSAPHLYWQWNHEGPSFRLFYGFFLFSVVALSYFGLPQGHINAILALLSYFISMAIYGDKHTVGAMWCFAAAFGPWILLLLYRHVPSQRQC